MKKNLVRFLSGILLIGLLVGCNSNSGTDNSIIGTWATVIDMTDAISETIAGQEMESFIEFNNLSISMNATFNEDGTYSMEVDSDSIADMVETYEEQINDGMMAYLENVIAELWDGMALDDYLDMSGMTREEAMEIITAGVLDPESFLVDFNNMHVDGNYKAENGRISMSNTLSEPARSTNYDSYIIEDDLLTIKDSGGTTVFKRIN